MVTATNSQEELRLLRTLCDESGYRVQRLELLKSLGEHAFVDPEHQIVFESIRSLYSRGGISRSRLAVHLNNRGFPDIEVEKYFSSVRAKGAHR